MNGYALAKGIGFLCLALAMFSLVATAAEPVSAKPLLAPLMKDVSEMRGLAFLGDVKAEVQKMDAFLDYVDGELEKDMPENWEEDMVQGLARLGMLPPQVDLTEQVKEVMSSQVAAYYDPEKKTFYYLDLDLNDLESRATAFHELVHALQDQHFDLAKMLASIEDYGDGLIRNDDATLALRSLVEGEATYLTFHWQALETGTNLSENKMVESMTFSTLANMDPKGLALMENAVRQSEDDRSLDAIQNFPAYLIDPLIAAYFKGAYFSFKIHEKHDWKGLSTAYSAPPLSSEQVMHPNKYLDTPDLPTIIEMPDWKFLKRKGWSLIDAAVHGEYYLGILLKEMGLDNETVRPATSGWDGDLYRAYRHRDGRIMFVLATTWDSAADAQQFADAYQAGLPNKYGNLGALQTINPELRRYACGEETLGEGALWNRGREVFVVEGLPWKHTQRMLKKLRGLRIEHRP